MSKTKSRICDTENQFREPKTTATEKRVKEREQGSERV